MTGIDLDFLTVADYLEVMDYPKTGDHKRLAEILQKVTPDIDVYKMPYLKFQSLLMQFAGELIKTTSPGDYILKFAQVTEGKDE